MFFSMTLADRINKYLEDKKGIDIVRIPVTEKTILTDEFIIVTGSSNTHMRALADYVEEELKKDDIYPNKIEGYNSNGWILLDYGEVVVHVFSEKEREHFNIEELWNK